MKIIHCLYILFLVFITSCSDKPSPAKQSQQPGSAGEIVNKYVNTLTTAQDKAKKAAGAVDAKIEEENKAAQDMEKQ
ncbi:MAG: hypothetical protein Q7T53_12935 [Deltaproteobacteria bacterium]|nr:hypothetical protein [Deltaproteobacteria bacterium]